MTDEELAAIEARANAATEGPWHTGPNGDREIGECVFTDESLWTEIVSAAECDRLADATFIAHARDDVPALVAEMRRLRARVAALENKTREFGW